jgi:hypothetical protein
MSQDLPKFTRINESFPCTQCGHSVPLAQSTCRDHCPRCLWSLHVDVNPGDRSAGCGAPLRPVSYSSNKKKGFMIHYECMKCGTQKVNRFLEYDEFEADSMEALLKLSGVSNLKKKV